MKSPYPVPCLCPAATFHTLATQLLAEQTKPLGSPYCGLVFTLRMQAQHTNRQRKIRRMDRYLHLLALRVGTEVYWFLGNDHDRRSRPLFNAVPLNAWQFVEADPDEHTETRRPNYVKLLDRHISAEVTDLSVSLKEKLKLRIYPPVSFMPTLTHTIFTRVLAETGPVLDILFMHQRPFHLTSLVQVWMPEVPVVELHVEQPQARQLATA